jgi:glycosyltransferase involved in cell wall biosynthesis
MIRTLLVSDDDPNTRYGSGQRLTAHWRALAELGECRILHLRPGAPVDLNGEPNFVAPVPFDLGSSRFGWAMRNATLGQYRQDRRFTRVFEGIRRLFPYNAVFCKPFRNACVAPTQLVPCFVDVDAFTPTNGLIEWFLSPVGRIVMQQFVKKFAGVYVIRESDRFLFGKGLSDRIAVIPGISASARVGNFSPPENKRVLFVGSVRWKPNRDAVEWLLDRRVPAILSEMGFELRLIGEDTDNISTEPGLSGAGFVEDLAAEYHQARLVLCPVFSGLGANIKLAEAVQYGCPVLASAHAANGYRGILDPGKHIEVFTTDEMFVHRLRYLVQSPGNLNRLRRRAVEVSVSILNQRYCSEIIARDIRRAVAH